MGELRIRVATRKSMLSIKQVEIVLEVLRSKIPELEAEYVFVETKGDVYGDLPPAMIGSKGIFEKEVNLAVLRGEADTAVHSMKDVPSEVSEGLVLGTVLPRESSLDVLVSKGRMRLVELREGAVVGTSSVRRRAALLCLKPDLRIEQLRGNIDTRIRKLEAGTYDAILTAEAGLRRLGFNGLIAQVFTPEEITPAPCQGAIGVYARKDDDKVLNILKEVGEHKARIEVTVEREITKRIGGGCFMPLGVLAEVAGDRMTITASLYSPTGKKKSTVILRGNVDERDDLVSKVSERLLIEGEPILSEVKVVFR